MRLMLVLPFVLALAAPAAAGEIKPGSPDAALADQLIAREKESWRLYKEKDEAALLAMTSADFADLYSGGDVVDRAEWLRDMRVVQVERQELSGFHAFRLADDAILLTYEGKAWGRTKAGPAYNDAAVTSAWALRDGRWLNVFYRETALGSPPVTRGYGADKARAAPKKP